MLLAAVTLFSLAVIAPSPVSAVTVDTTGQVSVNFTGNTTSDPSNWQLVPPFIPLDDPLLVKKVPGCAPEQVSVSGV